MAHPPASSHLRHQGYATITQPCEQFCLGWPIAAIVRIRTGRRCRGRILGLAAELGAFRISSRLISVPCVQLPLQIYALTSITQLPVWPGARLSAPLFAALAPRCARVLRGRARFSHNLPALHSALTHGGPVGPESPRCLLPEHCTCIAAVALFHAAVRHGRARRLDPKCAASNWGARCARVMMGASTALCAAWVPLASSVSQCFVCGSLNGALSNAKLAFCSYLSGYLALKRRLVWLQGCCKCSETALRAGVSPW